MHNFKSRFFTIYSINWHAVFNRLKQKNPVSIFNKVARNHESFIFIGCCLYCEYRGGVLNEPIRVEITNAHCLCLLEFIFTLFESIHAFIYVWTFANVLHTNDFMRWHCTESQIKIALMKQLRSCIIICCARSTGMACISLPFFYLCKSLMFDNWNGIINIF